MTSQFRLPLLCALIIFVGLSHVHADMMKILSPPQDTTLYVGSYINVTISITSDAPACADTWQLWLTALHPTGELIKTRIFWISRNDYPNSPLEQNVLTDRIPSLFLAPVANVSMYLQCVNAQTYPSTSYIMHDPITPYAELIVPEQPYYLGDPSAVLKWNNYGPSTTWHIWGNVQDGNFGTKWKSFCVTSDNHCIHKFLVDDGQIIMIRIQDNDGNIIQIKELPRLQQVTFNFNGPAAMYPSSNVTISWKTPPFIEFLQYLEYNINWGLYSPVTGSPKIPVHNTEQYLWHVPDTVKVGDVIQLLGCVYILGNTCGYQVCDEAVFNVEP